MVKLARLRVLWTNDLSRQPLGPSSTVDSCAGARHDYLALSFCLDLGDGVATRCTAPRHRPNSARKKRDARRDRVERRLREPPLRLIKRGRPGKTPDRLAGPHAAETPGGVARRVRTAAAADALLRAPLLAAARFVGAPAARLYGARPAGASCSSASWSARKRR